MSSMTEEDPTNESIDTIDAILGEHSNHSPSRPRSSGRTTTSTTNTKTTLQHRARTRAKARARSNSNSNPNSGRKLTNLLDKAEHYMKVEQRRTVASKNMTSQSQSQSQTSLKNSKSSQSSQSQFSKSSPSKSYSQSRPRDGGMNGIGNNRHGSDNRKSRNDGTTNRQHRELQQQQQHQRQQQQQHMSETQSQHSSTLYGLEYSDSEHGSHHHHNHNTGLHHQHQRKEERLGKELNYENENNDDTRNEYKQKEHDHEDDDADAYVDGEQQQQQHNNNGDYISSPSSVEVSVPSLLSSTCFVEHSSASLHDTDVLDGKHNHNDGDGRRKVKGVDGYVRSGAHFRDLLDHAFQKVAQLRIHSHIQGNGHGRSTSRNGRQRRGRKRKSKGGEEKDGERLNHNEGGDGDDDGEGQGNIDGEECRSASRSRGWRRKTDHRNDGDNRGNNHDHGYDNDEDVSDYDSDDESSSESVDHASALANEKVAEVLNLKRSLKEAQEEIKALTNVNSALREASTTSSVQIDNISQALRIAGEKAANARADADAAEARSMSLTTQLESFQDALEETKRTCEAIRMEHDDISSGARDLEKRLLQTEVELEKVRGEKNRGEGEVSRLSDQVEELKHGEKVLRSLLEKKEDAVAKLKKNLIERGDIEKARSERTNRLENELRDSRSMLVEMTSAAAEAESVTAELRNTVTSLQRENASLHDKIGDTIQEACMERTKLQKALTEAENESQKLRLKAAADDEELQKIKLDKMSSEKEVIQLQNRISNMEKRSIGRAENSEISMNMPLSAGVSSPSSPNDSGYSTISDISSIHTSSTYAPSMHTLYKTPSNDMTGTYSVTAKFSSSGKENNKENPLESDVVKSTRSDRDKNGEYCSSLVTYEKETRSLVSMNTVSSSSYCNRNRDSKQSNNGKTGPPSITRKPIGGISRKNSCCICYKAAYGIMKSCQCGNPSCDQRAHATCIAGRNSLPSVSHPGTPAPMLPVVLCSKK